MVFWRFCAAVVVSCVGMTIAAPVWASSPFQAVELADIAHGDATLTMVSPDGSLRTVDMAGIEELPTYRLETTTPWRDTPAQFEGVMLTDILALGGLQDAASVMVTAENDYQSRFMAEVWQNTPILVATRVNGAAISRRDRGPILFVIEAGTFAASTLANEAHLVWMAARIEPVE